MGGDHKCSVCQATFTRPQHVARHMRSHTGDRPYKCQFCGDQFARSDLLSRHVNKCHADEKPPAGATTTRRKGSASASRASTSKQACDQCVQSSLPCDGANPCSKCIQRKCRCTFVKFHRQTAPIGPGHNPHPPANSTSSRLSSYGTADDFLLGPAPPSIAPISGDPTSYNTSFTFPNLYTSTADSAPPSLAMPGSSDYNKFRSQADYMRRMTLPQPSGPTLYNDPRNAGATSWLGWGSETTAQLAAGSRPVAATDHHPKSDHPSFTYPPVAADTYIPSYTVRRVSHDRHPSVEFSSDSSSHSVPSSASSSSVHLPLDDVASQHQQHAYHDAQAQAHHNYLRYHQPHPAQQNQQGSNQGMQSGLPPHPNPNADSGQQEGGFSSAFGLMSLDDPSILAGLSNDGAPFFTSNGMDMYPGDPDATPMPPKSSTASITNNNNINNNNCKVTSHPIQPLSANSTHGSSTSRDEELKVLKESWKQYLRTPLQGSTPNGLNFSFSDSGSGSGPSNPVSPGPPYRRARVSSLPSVQTPSTERSQSQFGYAYQPSGNGGGNDGGNGATSSIRTTLHGNSDDLRSYEAAILARRPPLNLNLNMDLAMKRSRGATASSGMSPVALGKASSSSNPNASANPQQMQQPQKRGYEYHPPGSSSGGSRPSSSSPLSLANAFGKSHSHPHTSANLANHSHANVSANANAIFAYLANDHEQQHDGHGFGNPSPPSRGSTASLDESSNASEEGGDSGSISRPSFKRLPSQTLAPMNAKRAMLNRRSGCGFGEEGGENGDDDDAAADEDYRRREIGYRRGQQQQRRDQQQQQRDQQQQQQHLSPPQSHAMNVDRSGAPPPSSYGGIVAGRRRGMSAPDTSPTVGSFAAAGQL
ncbi:hypothetical protein BDN71DRAFT_1589359 [Pleurotus eryngii]|uniref:Uncharacterized protein n=1 Tax=Pleurotus eryngii TaxID=5323 RepID=A0A9P5ZX67_PLEER|nr:hypothetical protein BDN71DRAFT_1589359 [Pleurotus eryngii]